MAKIYLIHGFNVKDEGKLTTGTLRNLLEDAGHEVREIHYGWFGRIMVRLCNGAVAKTVAHLVDKGSCVVAHSNGAAIVYLAAKHGAGFRTVFLVNPALDSDLSIDGAEEVLVFHSLSDKWTRLAKFVPFSVWGDQGVRGYTGADPDNRYTNVPLDAIIGEPVGHSGVFKTATRRHKLANIILSRIPK